MGAGSVGYWEARGAHRWGVEGGAGVEETVGILQGVLKSWRNG